MSSIATARTSEITELEKKKGRRREDKRHNTPALSAGEDAAKKYGENSEEGRGELPVSCRHTISAETEAEKEMTEGSLRTSPCPTLKERTETEVGDGMAARKKSGKKKKMKRKRSKQRVGKGHLDHPIG